MSRDPAFLFYSSDFLVGTYTMTDAQVGQYIRLMCIQHQQGRLHEAAMLSVMGNKRDPLIMSKFIQDEDGRYYNQRLEDETNRRKRYSDSRRRNRAGSEDDTQDTDICCNDGTETVITHDGHMSNTCQSYDEHMETETVTVNITGSGTKTKPPSRTSKAELFRSFWAAYPRKAAKAAAQKAFDKTGPDDALLQSMLDSIAFFKHTEQWTRDGGKFIPYPATWLNQRRWEDEPPDEADEEVVNWTIR